MINCENIPRIIPATALYIPHVPDRTMTENMIPPFQSGLTTEGTTKCLFALKILANNPFNPIKIMLVAIILNEKLAILLVASSNPGAMRDIIKGAKYMIIAVIQPNTSRTKVKTALT